MHIYQICRAIIYIKVFDIAALRHCTCYFGKHHKHDSAVHTLHSVEQQS